MKRLPLRCAWFLFCLSASAIAHAASPSEPVQAAVTEHQIAGYRIRLHSTDGQACQVEYHSPQAKGEARMLALDLQAPCRLLTWQGPPPRKTGGPKSAQALGKRGEAQAWRYPDAGNVIALAVIGDAPDAALQNSSLYRLRQSQGMHCAGSLQGLLLYPAEIKTSAVQRQSGVFCLEIGLEEKNFWLLAHP
ncbi:hypothetical protein V8J88_18955 [Massilia sp. W12]|uniref:hypothetical protein n=1 Tax=Massilia sp. W12 TaxID=3126507 RepID=UPI0030CB8297